MAGPPSRGGSAGIQQPGWPLLPQQAWCLRSLMKVLDAAIRNLLANEASQVVQLEKKAPGLDFGRGSSPGSGITQTLRRMPSPLESGPFDQRQLVTHRRGTRSGKVGVFLAPAR